MKKQSAQDGLNRLPNKELRMGSPRPGAGQLTLSRTCLQVLLATIANINYLKMQLN